MVGIGTAYRIRTGDLRLERAVSWASRRMRPDVHRRAANGPEYSKALCGASTGRGPRNDSANEPRTTGQRTPAGTPVSSTCWASIAWRRSSSQP